MNKLIAFLLSLVFIVSMTLFLSPGSMASSKKKSFTTKTKTCQMSYIYGPSARIGKGFFKANITGYYTKKHFVLAAVRYSFGPTIPYYGDANNLFVYYTKPNGQKAQWASADNLVSTGGTMKKVKGLKPIKVKKGSWVNVRGYLDTPNDDPHCAYNFKS